MEEERRLFYVAVTRARRQLFLTYPMTAGYETLMFNQPSTFLEEVSPRLFERVELRESRSSVTHSPSQTPRTGGWSWDEGDGWQEPTIRIDAGSSAHKPKAGTVVWKSNEPTPPKKKPGSFLREVGDL